MKLRLIRLVLVKLGTKLTEWFDSAHTDAAITVKPYGTPLREGPNNSTLTLLEASCVLDTLPVENDTTIHVPADVRRSLESKLESHVDVLAVLNQCTRLITSPHPYIAIEPLDEEGTEWIQGKHIHVSTSGIPARMWHEFSFQKSLPHLSDRLDGVSLIAEALGHSHPTGELHEYIRFFERAFALPAGRVCKNELPEFLTGMDKCYDKAEVNHWLHLRDITAHADRRSEFAIQSDTRPVVHRVEQAAYDVLFNKAVWRNNSVDRRDIFSPFVGSSDNSGGLFITQGQRAVITMSMVDGFHAYPLGANACIKQIPDHWLVKTTAEVSTQ